MMTVVIRADASIHIGSGHIMRCLVLGAKLQKSGYIVCFACLPQHGDLITVIENRGFHVIKLTPLFASIQSNHDADYISWLQRSIDEDANDFLNLVSKADLVITDHYAIGAQWQSHVKNALKCKILAIDDLLREHDADIILDQTLGRKAESYKDCDNILTGMQFALLQSQFSILREDALERNKPAKQIKVLVSMGGIDQPNATLQVLKVLVNNKNLSITVLLSPRAPHYQSVLSFAATQTTVTHFDFVEDMAKMMLNHDVAIGAPGTTSWERACLGLPSITVPLADNQKEITRQLIKHQAALSVEINDLESNLCSVLSQLLNQWSEYSQVNLTLCDGLGTNRVVQEVNNMMDVNQSQYQLVLATENDIKLIYQWQCHEETRKYALQPTVPSWDEHDAWMRKKLKQTTDYFYLIQNRVNKKKVGAIRLDRIEAHHYIISIFMSPNSYGQGIAYNALQLINAIHPHITIKATVLAKNTASQRLFEKANYQRITTEQFIRLPIQ